VKTVKLPLGALNSHGILNVIDPGAKGAAVPQSPEYRLSTAFTLVPEPVTVLVMPTVGQEPGQWPAPWKHEYTPDVFAPTCCSRTSML
jgi:hypothetical protein